MKATEIIKLKCNVCTESPTVKLPEQPNHVDQVIYCPSCDKQLSWVREDCNTGKLFWNPIDTKKDKTGHQAVIVVN